MIIWDTKIIQRANEKIVMELFIIFIMNWPLTNIDQTHYLTFDKNMYSMCSKNSIIPDISNYMQFIPLKNLSKPKACFHILNINYLYWYQKSDAFVNTFEWNWVTTTENITYHAYIKRYYYINLPIFGQPNLHLLLQLWSYICL